MDQSIKDALSVEPQALVIPFLKAALEAGIQATVIYRFQRDGKEVINVTSNQGEAGMQRDLGWAMKIDENKLRAAAAAMMNALDLPGFQRFDKMNARMQAKILAAVRAGFEVAATQKTEPKKIVVPS